MWLFLPLLILGGLLGLWAGSLVSPLPWAAAQEHPVPQEGLTRVDPRWHVLVHATVISEPGARLENCTVVIRHGVLISVEVDGQVPPGARVWDCTGLTLTAGFIEPHLPVEVPSAAVEAQHAHWNPALIQPQRSALDGAGVDARTSRELRALGFTAAALAPTGGILRGRGAVVALGEAGDEVQAGATRVIARDVFQAVALEGAGFARGADAARSTSGPRYPNSQMGAIALLRQVLADAAWHAQMRAVTAAKPAAHEPVAPSAALEALAGEIPQEVPFLFLADDELQAFRIARVAREFSRRVILRGSGTEFRRLPGIAALGLPVITPLAFPEAPGVKTIDEAESVSLRELLTWEQAPAQPRRLLEAGLVVALTTDRLADRKEFTDRLRQAIRHGLAPQDALAMLTTTPARLLGVEGRLGRVAPGYLAHLVVLSGEPFARGTEVRGVWVQGRYHEVTPAPRRQHEGAWELTAIEWDASLTGGGTLQIGTREVAVTAFERKASAREVAFGDGGRLSFHLDGAELGVAGVFVFSGFVDGDELRGSYFGPGGLLHPWSARRQAAAETPVVATPGGADADIWIGTAPIAVLPPESPVSSVSSPAPEAREGTEDAPILLEEVKGVPWGAYGIEGIPPQVDLVITGATLWTSGPAGIVEDGVVLTRGGRIVYAGAATGAPPVPAGARVIDARGKHVTPGLIDCHSHTGISGSVNETGQRVTAEVRIGDVIDPDDINWYRQLAGGLTVANQLHGSANAIGGQNSVVKLRWGVAEPEAMLFESAPPGIKFALGENPKRVAAGGATRARGEYPQSRMGVEALIIDRLAAGRTYRAAWQRYQALSEAQRLTVAPPRRDLELEALGEVVAGERLVHCHSYRQDEILMLCHVANEFGFKIGTFQHVLEGYKVADAIRDASLGGSTFSDWWAFKFEVIDAIPHNATLMHDVGVCVSINSDSDEHARRLNTEAGKAMKYGGLDPHAALQLVTLNPARQLGIAERVGSLESGKDADLVVWSNHPLSYRSRCERTFIDGREYYSLERHQALEAAALEQRAHLIQKLLAEVRRRPERGGSERRGRRGREAVPSHAPGAVVGPVDAWDHEHDDAREREALWLDAWLRSGGLPGTSRPGECGCSAFDLMGYREEVQE